MRQYDVIFWGYPIWAVDTPQAIESFIKAYNWKGKQSFRFARMEVSDRAAYTRKYRNCVPARIPYRALRE